MSLERRRVSPTASSFARVLLVNGEPSSAPSGTGVTLGRLFEDWPRERLAQIYTAASPHSLTGTIDYHVRTHDRQGLRLLTLPSDSAALSRRGSVSQNALPKSGRGVRFLAAVKSEARQWLDLIPYELPADVEKEIVDFRPHLIYSCLGNIQISRLALRLARLCRVPVIPHFMDDWISTQYASRPDQVIHRALLLRVVDSVLATAPLGLAISEAMASEYSARFGKPFHAFMNCIPISATAPSLPPLSSAPGLVYVGGLHLNRWRALCEIGIALAAINREGISGNLIIYAPPADLAAYGDKLAESGIGIGGSLSQAEIPAAIAAADVLVYVESFEPKTRRYTRLSISTKIPQYAAAARPLFCYGPPEVASIRFVQENAFGLIAGSQDGSDLNEKLRRMLEDTGLRQNLAARAFAVARRDFNSNSVRQRFQAVLRSAASFQPLPLVVTRQMTIQ